MEQFEEYFESLDLACLGVRGLRGPFGNGSKADAKISCSTSGPNNHAQRPCAIIQGHHDPFFFFTTSYLLELMYVVLVPIMSKHPVFFDVCVFVCFSTR